MDAKRSELKREFGMDDPYWDPEPKPPPRLYAVWVCHVPLGNWEGDKPSCRKPGDRPSPYVNHLSGVTGLGDKKMTTKTHEVVDSTQVTIGIVIAFVTGLALLFASGYAQATALHDAAHDQRHAMAFPCH